MLVLLGSPKRSPFRGSLATTNVLALRQTLGLAVITSPGMIPFLTLERETVKLVTHGYSSFVSQTLNNRGRSPALSKKEEEA